MIKPHHFRDAIVTEDIKRVVEYIKSDPEVVNRPNELGSYPVFWAAGISYAIFSILIDSGADIEVTSPNGESLLCVAEDPEIMTLLVDNQLDVHHQNKNGDTPLHAKASGGSVKLVKRLLDLGASQNIENNAGFRPREVAAKSVLQLFEEDDHEVNIEVFGSIIDRQNGDQLEGTIDLLRGGSGTIVVADGKFKFQATSKEVAFRANLESKAHQYPQGFPCRTSIRGEDLGEFTVPSIESLLSDKLKNLPL